MRYVSIGDVPRKRHTQVRDEQSGELLVEVVMGYEELDDPSYALSRHAGARAPA